MGRFWGRGSEPEGDHRMIKLCKPTGLTSIEKAGAACLPAREVARQRRVGRRPPTSALRKPSGFNSNEKNQLGMPPSEGVTVQWTA